MNTTKVNVALVPTRDSAFSSRGAHASPAAAVLKTRCPRGANPHERLAHGSEGAHAARRLAPKRAIFDGVRVTRKRILF
jgi:hypothetical protein